ncbi:MAG: hypothetical protein ACHQQ3_06055 [Gemmatimonadales bacterium]
MPPLSGRLFRAAAALTCLASVLSAQATSTREVVWNSYEPPDSSFAVLFPQRGHVSITSNDAGSDKITSYVVNPANGTTTLLVKVWENEAFAKRDPSRVLDQNRLDIGLTRVSNTDSTLHLGPYAGRWGHTEGDAGKPPRHQVIVYRAFVAGARMYVVSASSLPGQKLSADADKFIESFTICEAAGPCTAPRAPMEGPSSREKSRSSTRGP